MNNNSESNVHHEFDTYPLLQVLLESMDLAAIRRLIDLLSIIHEETPNRHQLITNVLNHRRTSDNLPLYDISNVKSIIYLFQSCRKLMKMFITELPVTEEIYRYNMSCQPQEKINSNYITPFTKNCILCGRLLVSPKSRMIVYFKQVGIESALLFEYRCRSSQCNTIYCGNYYRLAKSDRIIITPTSILHSDVVYFGGDSAYEKILLLEFTSALLFSYVPFYGFTNAYNYRNSLKNVTNFLNNKQLQDKHFQSIWIQYQMACMYFMTTKDKNFQCLLSFVSAPEIRDQYLRETNKLLEPLFMILWTNHKKIAQQQHIFKYDKLLKQNVDKCSTCMVADGHEKSSRLICAFKSSASIRHDELGPVEIGCAETPLRRTNADAIDAIYCRKHQPRSSDNLENNNETTNGVGVSEETPNVQSELSLNQSMNDSNIYSKQNHLYNLRTNVRISNENGNTNSQNRKLTEIDEQIKSILGLDDDVDVAKHVFNVYRDSLLEQKNSSCGFTAVFYDCGVIVAFQESIRSESVRRLLFLILTLVKTVNNNVPNALLYDNACSLRIFIDKWYNKQFFKNSPYSTFIKNMHIAIDRFHQDNHCREICKTIMRADDSSHQGRFQNVNSEICEQMFAYFAKFKSSFRNYSYPKSFTFYMLLFHLKNCELIKLHPCTQSVNINELYQYSTTTTRLTKRPLENNDTILKKHC